MTGPRPTVNPVLAAKLLRVEQLVKAARYEDAARLLDKLLVKHPHDPYANFRAGWLCALRGHYDIGLDFMRRALAASDVPWAEALNALGAILMRLGRYDEGLPFLRDALKIEPRNPEAWINLANWAEGMGDDDLALDILARTSRHPGNLGSPGIRWARSFIRLKRGDWPAGWDDYECRWLNTEWLAARNRTFRPDSRYWTGEPLTADDHLFVHFEQGLGDVVMSLRYLPWLRRRVPARLTLQLQGQLHPLLVGQPDLCDRLVDEHTEPEPYGWHVSVMSLPSVHRTTLDTIPPPLGLAAAVARG